MELLPLYLEDVKDKIRSVKGRFAKTKSQRKREKLKRQLAKLERGKQFYKNHIKNGTVPKTIFGGRRSFEALLKAGSLGRSGGSFGTTSSTA